MRAGEFFKGNFFEIGEQQGKIYLNNKKKLDKVKIVPYLYKKQLAAYNKYYPEILDEFRGIASAGGFDADKLIYYMICDELRWYSKRTEPKKACTIFGVSDDNGVFVGRNYDWVPATEKFFQVYNVAPANKYKYVAVSDMDVLDQNTNSSDLFYWATDAINDRGLFIGLTFAYDNKTGYGLSSIHVPRFIAERCSTVDEALIAFNDIRLACPKNFFIADRYGNMAVVEHTSERFKVLRPRNGVLIKTNHYIDAELSKEDTILKVKPNHNSFKRYAEAEQKINDVGSGFKAADIMSVLGSLDSCVYQDLPSLKTIWSLALDMKKRNYMIYWDMLNGGNSLDLRVR